MTETQELEVKEEQETSQEETQEEVVSLSEDEKNRILEGLAFANEITKDITIFEGRITVILRNLSGDDQMQIEKEMKDIEGTTAYVVHTYTTKLLGSCVKEYQDTVLDKLMPLKERQQFIQQLPTATIDVLSDEVNQFHKEIQAATSGKKVGDSFFANRSTDSESN